MLEYDLMFFILYYVLLQPSNLWFCSWLKIVVDEISPALLQFIRDIFTLDCRELCAIALGGFIIYAI